MPIVNTARQPRCFACRLFVALWLGLLVFSGTPLVAAGSKDLEMAMVASDRGQYAQAVLLATRAIASGELQGVPLARAYAVRAEAYWRGGNSHQGTSDNVKAISIIDKAVQAGGLSKGDLALAYNVRGNANRNIDRLDEAISDYTAAIETMPSFYKAYLNRGNIQVALRRYTLALHDYEGALREKPDYSKASYSKARTLVRLGRYDEAIATYGQTLAMDPKAPSRWIYYFGRGSALYLKGDYPKAIADYESSLALNPRFSLTKKNLERARAALRQQLNSPEADVDSIWEDLLTSQDSDKRSEVE